MYDWLKCWLTQDCFRSKRGRLFFFFCIAYHLCRRRANLDTLDIDSSASRDKHIDENWRKDTNVWSYCNKTLQDEPEGDCGTDNRDCTSRGRIFCLLLPFTYALLLLFLMSDNGNNGNGFGSLMEYRLCGSSDAFRFFRFFLHIRLDNLFWIVCFLPSRILRAESMATSLLQRVTLESRSRSWSCIIVFNVPCSPETIQFRLLKLTQPEIHDGGLIQWIKLWYLSAPL